MSTTTGQMLTRLAKLRGMCVRRMNAFNSLRHSPKRQIVSMTCCTLIGMGRCSERLIRRRGTR